jgi:hypothetical protein
VRSAVRLDQEGDKLLVARRRVRPQVIPALLVPEIYILKTSYLDGNPSCT